MNSAELDVVVIGLLCLVGFLVVAVETREHRRIALKKRTAAGQSQADGTHFVRR